MYRRITAIIFFLWFSLWGSGLLLMAAPAATNSVTRFELVRNYLIVVPVVINGQGPFKFLLDTGTDTTIILTELAQKLELRAVDRMELVTVAGTQIVPRVQVERLALGRATATEVEALCTELAALRAVAPAVQGVLGQSFLARFNYLLDYHNRELTFETGEELAQNWSGARLSVEQRAGRMLLAAGSDVGASAGLRLVLDSGVATLILFQPISPEAGLEFDQSNYQLVKAATDAGSQTVRLVRLGRLQLGRVVLEDLPAALMPARPGEARRVENGLLPVTLFERIYFNHRIGFIILNPQPR